MGPGDPFSYPGPSRAVVSLSDFTAPRFDVLEEVGAVELPRTGRIIQVRVS